LVRAPYAIAGILLIVTLFYASNASQNSGNHAVNPIDQLVKQRHIVTFKNPALPIKALNFAYFKIDVPSGATSVRLLGNFTASGGTGNDVVAFLFPENDFVNWQNRHATTNLYNSGMVTVGTIDVNLPSNVATYYLVFNNRFSLFAQKTVDVDVTLAYYQ
jgi:hypothetical protein